MANFATLKAAINAVIKTNGNKEITGEVLNQVLNAMVTSLGANYQFAGVATPSTNPGTPDQNIFYMAIEAGTYTNFNATVLPAGISILLWNGSWSHETFFEIDSVPTSGSDNFVSSGAVFEKMKLDGGAYDVSAHNSGATFASLSALLSSENLNTLIPVDVRHGGMSIKFVQSSDNKYVQYRFLLSGSFTDAQFANIINWQGDDNDFFSLEDDFGKLSSEFESYIKTSQTISFSENGYVRYSDGITNNEGGYNTGKIAIDGFSKLSLHSSSLNSSAAVVAFFDYRDRYLKELSIIGNGSSLDLEIDLTLSQYGKVKTVVVSTWNTPANCSVFNENPIKFNQIGQNTYEIRSILSDMSVINKSVEQLQKSNTTIKIDQEGYIKYSDGTLVSGGYNTGKQFIFGYTDLIVNSSSLGSTAALVAFYDTNKNYMKDISISGYSVRDLEIDLTESIYNNVGYINVSSWASGYSIKLNNKNRIPVSFLDGKNFCCLGDSISDGDGNNSYSWYDMLLKRYNAGDKSLNFARSGQCMRTMSDRCTAENMADIDYCFVMGGTNTVSLYSLGTINDVPTPDKWEPEKVYSVGDRVLGGTIETHGGINTYLYWYECTSAGTSGNSADASGFSTTLNDSFIDGTVTWKCVGSPSWYSDMKGIIRRVWGFNPKIQIIWIVPIKAKGDTGLDPSTWSKSQKFQAIRNFCEAYSIRYIDLQKEFPLNIYTKDAIMFDYYHPNETGYKIIQDIVCSHIE